MNPIKIISIKEPVKTDREHSDDVFILDIDFGNGAIIKCYKNRLGYNSFMLEMQLLDKGVDCGVLHQYRDALKRESEYEIGRDFYDC